MMVTEDGGKSWNEYPLPPDVDLAVLERVINEILRRHDALRTCFPLAGEEPVQRINPFETITLQIADLSKLDEPDRAQHANLISEREAR